MTFEDFDYAEHERQCEARRQENARYLAAFEGYLENAGLKESTIRRHLDNASFYLNTYLLREKPLPMEEGCRKADDFFGYFFICKCMWSTPGTIRSTVASLKKFYKSMAERGMVAPESYEHFIETIREGLEYWVEDCRQFNDPSSDNPFALF